ncbi:uncharacterized protein N7500_008792 [Penicillium coprophilum]|uniref:uncharacterized protein n=1 Tax=Penicillium coprophilum TaxID=36646 RepID=UPI0023850466|nr:uncharacterized protein N7500_008792 [Penicillium coprophilum]KAJ5159141.1 hypothetical protein N7500_008792 [Penicillium coprophilum]
MDERQPHRVEPITENAMKSSPDRLEPTTHIAENGSFSLIERVILSAGAMLIFSVYFLLTICPEGRNVSSFSSL